MGLCLFLPGTWQLQRSGVISVQLQELRWFRTWLLCLRRPGDFWFIFIFRGHSFRIPTQMKEDSPGPLTWVGLRLRFLSLDPWVEWLLSHTLRSQRTPLEASGPLCLSHLLGPLFSQDFAWQGFAVLLILGAFKKVSFRFFQLCSEGDLVWII